MKKFLIYLVTIILSISIGVCSTILVLNKYTLGKKEIETVVKDVTINETNTIKESIDQIYDAVVIIETYSDKNPIGTGTGFVYKIQDDKAYVMTNYHVIEGSDEVKITNTKDITVDAKVLGGDSLTDIAVLSIEKDAALKKATIGDSREVELGDTVFTVGSPLGKKYIGTVTKGIISGVDRLVTVSNSTNGSYMMQLLQTDAAINPGNSGGPLVNIKGEVVGITSMKFVEEKIEGMGFAIPVEIAMSSIDKLEKGEEVKRPVLGVELIDATNTYALYFNKLTIDENIKNGAVIAKIVDDSSAAKSDLKKGDVILEINEEKVENSSHLRFLLYKYNVGNTIELTVSRKGKIIKVKVTL